jgi:uncharacterized membrane protein YfcA
MPEFLPSLWLIAAVFFLIAFAYATVGLGGASSYTALMAILGFEVLAIPTVSLVLNLIVTTLGSFNFIRKRHARLKLVAPFLVSSIPMAYLGGSLHVDKVLFHWILLISLLFVAARIYLWDNMALRLKPGKIARLVIALLSGSLIGLVSGIVGIGGGIYLVPLIIILGLGSEQQAAACGMIFIWLNSAAGLIARLQHNPIDLGDYLPLILAVLTGGLLGSHLGSTTLRPETMQRVLGVIVVVAIVLLLKKVFSF